jgi:hypothetical protein
MVVTRFIDTKEPCLHRQVVQVQAQAQVQVHQVQKQQIYLQRKQAWLLLLQQELHMRLQI